MVEPSTPRHTVTELASREPTRPRLTWYGHGGERVELSGRVLATWIAKTANLLVEEDVAGPGIRIGIDLPPHWRALVWTWATWLTGAEAVLADRAEPADPRTRLDAVATDRPEPWAAMGPATPQAVLAVALPPLAVRWPGDLPPHVLDAAAAAMSQPDAPGWLPSHDVSAPALSGLSITPFAYKDLPAWAATPPPRRRGLHVACDVADLVAASLRHWGRDGSLVIVEPGAADEARLRRIAEQEGAEAAR